MWPGFIARPPSIANGACFPSTNRFTSTERVKKDVTLGAADSIKVALTTEEGSKAKRAHQAFLVLKEKSTGLEAPFPLTVKDSGKATLKIVRARYWKRQPAGEEDSMLMMATKHYRRRKTYRFSISAPSQPSKPASSSAPLARLRPPSRPSSI